MSKPSKATPPGMKIGFGTGINNALVRAMLDDGVDVTNTIAVETWVDRFNRLPYEERVKRTEPRPLLLPKHETPTREDLDNLVGETPIARHFQVLNEYFASGKKLTATGNLALSDARFLVTTLETGDRLAYTIDREYKVRSATELPRLMGIMELATECGVLRIQHGKMLAIKTWPNTFEADPFATAEKCVRAAIDIGFATVVNLWGYGRDELLEYVDSVPAHLLAIPFASDEPDNRDDILSALAANYLHYQNHIGELSGRSAEQRLGMYLDDFVWTAELCGIVKCIGAGSAGDRGSRTWSFDKVEMTRIGRYFVRPLLDANAAYEFEDK
jgi:hypothetical protein